MTIKDKADQYVKGFTALDAHVEAMLSSGYVTGYTEAVADIMREARKLANQRQILDYLASIEI